MTTLTPQKISNNTMLLGRPLMLLGGILLFMAFAFVVSAIKNSPSSQAATAQAQLLSQVDTSAGAPVSGRDPSAQIQTSLAAAASTPGGLGQRVSKPAANVVGTTRHVDPASVLPDTKTTGVLASGCLAGYGVPGAQCVPAVAPGNQPVTCSFINTMFPKGVKVNGADSLKLGATNGTACAGGSTTSAAPAVK